MEYLNFELELRSSDGRYWASVQNSPEKIRVHVPFDEPFEQHELDSLLLQLRPRKVRMSASDNRLVQRLGGQLFASIFQDDVRAVWHSSMQYAAEQNAGIRLLLRMHQAQALGRYPWEYLFELEEAGFLAMHQRVAVVRSIDRRNAAKPVRIKPPLRILVVISSPTSADKLNVEREWESIQTALKPSQRAVTADRLSGATRESLFAELEKNEYHVLHFIGHSDFVAQDDSGYLILEGPNGATDLLLGDDFSQRIAGSSIALAILNSCKGASQGNHSQFSGIAQNLIRRGVPAVVAMQREISDDAATWFAQSFYGSLASFGSVDDALRKARIKIDSEASQAGWTGVEWGTPALYGSPESIQLVVRPRDLLKAEIEKTPGEPIEIEMIVDRKPVPNTIIEVGHRAVISFAVRAKFEGYIYIFNLDEDGCEWLIHPDGHNTHPSSNQIAALRRTFVPEGRTDGVHNKTRIVLYRCL